MANGLEDATTDGALIRRWFSQWPTANLALATGAASGLVVLDIDPRHGGLESMKALTNSAEPGRAWGTGLIQRTGSGGYHAFFEHPDRLFRNRVGFRPGLDIRGDGGYVIVAPSLHASGGRYEWLP